MTQPYFDITLLPSENKAFEKAFTEQYDRAFQHIAEKIGILMEEKGLSQSDLANILEQETGSVATVKVFRLVHGISMPYPKLFLKVCGTLGVSAQELLLNEIHPVPLPKTLTAVAKLFTLPDKNSEENVVDYFNQQIGIANECISKSKDECANVIVEEKEKILTKKRIKEYLHDRDMHNFRFFVENGSISNSARLSLEKYLYNQRGPKKGIEVQISSVIILSLTTGVPADYFIARIFGHKL